MKGQRDVFVFGLDDFHREQLATIEDAHRLRFHQLLEHDEAIHPEYFPVDDMLAKSVRTLEAFPGTVDAVCTYWDFPTSTLVPILRERLGLPGAGLTEVLKLEHKYWARLEQQAVVPDLIPPFDWVDPFADEPGKGLALGYPFWLKPIKAHSSYLGFKIHNHREFRDAIEKIRAGIYQFGEPFNAILDKAELPPDIAPVRGYQCIAEGIISAGQQATLEGYVYNGETRVYGVIDSIRGGPHRSSFSRYQYPSQLPNSVERRMTDAAIRVMAHSGYDNAPFNMEFFWNRRTDALALLEVNARCSKSHSPMFHMVDGASHFQVMAHLGLGEAPSMPHRAGHYSVAAKFMLRAHRDGQVTRVPSDDDMQRLEERFPEACARVGVTEGQRLSALRFQDSYSFELGEIFLGGKNRADLLRRYQEAKQILDFRIDHDALAA